MDHQREEMIGSDEEHGGGASRVALLNGDVRKEDWEVAAGGSKSSKLGKKAWAESRKLWVIVGPAIFSRVATYSMNVITQAFAGHLDDLELAAVSFANTVVVGFNYGLMGETICATIWKNLIENYESKIIEGSIYTMSNFKVQEDSTYRPVKNTLKIVFLYNTNVNEVDEEFDQFQNYYFEFASRDTLLERKSNVTQCSDIIGLLTKIKKVEARMIMRNTANPRQKYIREIELLISKDDKVKITLWGGLAHSLNEDVICKKTIVIVTSTMVEGLQSMLSLKSTNASRLYINLDLPETRKIIERLSNEEENVPKLVEADKSKQDTEEEQMFYQRKTLFEITQMRHQNPTEQDFVFTSNATIDQLKENTTWWYMSCNYCNKMCNKIQNNYFCKRCNKTPEALTARYWIRFQISDHTTTTTCTLFDDEAQ